MNSGIPPFIQPGNPDRRLLLTMIRVGSQLHFSRRTFRCKLLGDYECIQVNNARETSQQATLHLKHLACVSHTAIHAHPGLHLEIILNLSLALSNKLYLVPTLRLLESISIPGSCACHQLGCPFSLVPEILLASCLEIYKTHPQTLPHLFQKNTLFSIFF